MAAKKVGTLIREARTAAGMTQAQLAKKVTGLTATDISRAERGEKDLTQAQLKAIAKATGVTQSSLLNAPKGGSSSSSAKKPASSSSSSASSSSSGSTSVKVTAAEKKLLTLYRKADAKTKKAVLTLLEKQSSGGILGNGDDLLDSLLEGAASLLGGKK